LGHLQRKKRAHIIKNVKKIAVWSQKGGVGKSTVTALLGLALRDMGHRVGFLDIDLSGSTLHKALGLSEPPRIKTSTEQRKLIPPEINGYYLFSICAHFGEANSVMWKGETGTVEIPDEVMEKVQNWLKANQDIVQKCKEFLEKNPDVHSSFEIVQEADVYNHQAWYLKQTYVSNRASIIRQLLSEQVQWPDDTEILLADMPPSTASEVFSFFEHLSGLLGVIIVSQPSEISALGMRRTVDFLRLEEVPIIGLLSMMDGYLCPSCGRVSHQLLSPKLAMGKEARDCGIPFLMSIPQTPDMNALKPYFTKLAQDILTAKPVTLRRESRGQRVKRGITKMGGRVIAKLT